MPLPEWLRHLQELADNPLTRGYDTIAGAPQRAVASLIGQGNLGGFTDEANSADYTHAMERRLGMQTNHSGPMQALVDFAAQTVTDPVSYIPGADVVSVGGRLLHAAGAGRALEAMSRLPAIDLFLSRVNPDHDLMKSTTASGKNIVYGHEAAHRSAQARRDTHINDLINRHAEHMNATGEIHPEVRHALQSTAYREGTPAVRRQVMADGYVPTAEERTQRPLNILTSYKGAEYVPKQSLSDEAEASYASHRAQRQGNKKAGFSEAQHAGDESAPLADRVRHRLLKGSYLQNYHGSRADILHDLGLVGQPNVRRTEERLAQARATEARVGQEAPGHTPQTSRRYEALLDRQRAAASDSVMRQMQHLKPNAATTSKNLTGRFLDENTALERARRDVALGNEPGAEAIARPGSLPKEVSPVGLKAQYNQQLAQSGLVGKVRGAARRGLEDTRSRLEAMGGKASIAAPSARTSAVANKAYQTSLDLAEKYGTKLIQQRAANSAIRSTKRGARNLLDEANTINIPQTLEQRLFGTKIVPQGGNLKALSDIGRDAMFSTTSLPHKKNISILQLMGPGGVGSLAKGIGYSRKLKQGDQATQDLVKQLEAMGGTEHYMQDMADEGGTAFGRALGSAVSRVPIAGKSLAGRPQRVNEALDRFDTGQRLALMQHLAKQGTQGFDAGGVIRDVLGDYHNVSDVSRELRNRVGAAFPHFHLGIVPKAFARAARTNPKALLALDRSQKDINEDYFEPEFGADFHMGGPAEDGARLFTPPLGTAKYLSSASLTGPLGEAAGMMSDFKRGKFGRISDGLARSYAPGYAPAANLTFGSQYGSPMSPAVDFLSGMGGSYFAKQKKPPKPSLDDLLQAVNNAR